MGFSLDQSRWNQLLAFAGSLNLRWRKCALRSTQKHLVPAAPGVYAIEIPAPFQLANQEDLDAGGVVPIRYPVYIGESSSNIRSRFVAHTGEVAQDRILAVRKLAQPHSLPAWFIWCEIADKANLEKLESLLIDCFRPPCNKIGGVKLSDGIPAGSMSLQ